ncbi:MAG TPA: hypothetical protein VJI71_01610, partial [Candidatus Norongarragalinales archaeon]|nr:hypothetical protein [Candidatus Norongarragalinales archaeon]
VVGKGMLVPGLDEEVLKTGEGDSKTVSVPAEKAFGERKADFVRLIPLSKFKGQDVAPSVGMSLEVDGMPARVVGVDGGRVRLDFNHPLAGQALEYSFKIVKVYSNPAGKVTAVVSNLFKGVSGVSGELTGDKAFFVIPSKVRKDAVFLQQKFKAIEFLLGFVPEVKKVVFQEEYAVEQPPEQQ